MHGIDTRRLRDYPVSGSQSTGGKDSSISGSMGELDAFAFSGEPNEVVAHHVSTPQGMRANLVSRAFADDATPSMGNILGFESSSLAENFEKAFGGATGSILLVPMVRLNNFRVEILSKNFSGDAGKMEEKVDASGIVASPNHGDTGGECSYAFLFRRGVPGGSNDNRFPALGSQLGYASGGIAETEIDYHVAVRDERGRIIAQIDGAGDFGISFGGKGGNGLAHPPLGPVQQNSKGHGKGSHSRPSSAPSCERWVWFSDKRGDRGRRTSWDSSNPRWCMRNLTGTGLGSTKRS